MVTMPPAAVARARSATAGPATASKTCSQPRPSVISRTRSTRSSSAGGDDVRGAGVAQLRRLRARPAGGDRDRADAVRDRDRREPHARRGGGDQDVVAGLQPARLDQPAVADEERHPHRGAVDPARRLRQRHERAGGDDGAVGVDAVVVHRERRDHADPVAHRPARDALAERRDRARALVAEAGRQRRGLDVLAAPEHRLGPVEADRGDVDGHLAGPRGRVRFLLDPQHLGVAELGEPHRPRHDRRACRLDDQDARSVAPPATGLP